MDELRKPLFLLAVMLIALAVLVELGSAALIGSIAVGTAANLATKPPGWAIFALAALDGLVLYTVVLMGIALAIPERIHGRLQGIATLVVGLIDLIFSSLQMIAMLAPLTLMVSLFVAAPFGTLAYMAVYGDFETTRARALLGLIMALKLGFAVCLVLAHQRFITMKGLVLIIATSFVASLVVAFLHALVPWFLVSITDAIAAIVVFVLAIAWSIAMLIGSIPAVLKALRPASSS